MTKLTITDEIVEAGAKASFEYRPNGAAPLLKWKDVTPSARDFHMSNMRAALEAAVAMLKERAEIRRATNEAKP
jgi:hypothetical protein